MVRVYPPPPCSSASTHLGPWPRAKELGARSFWRSPELRTTVKSCWRATSREGALWRFPDETVVDCFDGIFIEDPSITLEEFEAALGNQCKVQRVDEGIWLMVPPRLEHQLARGALSGILRRGAPDEFVVVEGSGWQAGDLQYIPDVAVLRRDQLDLKASWQPPVAFVLVCEMLSVATARADAGSKKRRYAERSRVAFRSKRVLGSEVRRYAPWPWPKSL